MPLSLSPSDPCQDPPGQEHCGIVTRRGGEGQRDGRKDKTSSPCYNSVLAGRTSPSRAITCASSSSRGWHRTVTLPRSLWRWGQAGPLPSEGSHHLTLSWPLAPSPTSPHEVPRASPSPLRLMTERNDPIPTRCRNFCERHRWKASAASDF